MWVKFKFRFAYGEDKKWSYKEIPDDWKTYGYDEKEWENDEDEALCDYLANEERLHSLYDYSELYRGFKAEKIEGYPPVDEIIKRLKKCERNAEYYTEESKRFREMLDVAGHITKKDSDIT